MVKELRYELLQILEKMEPKADVDAQKTKDGERSLDLESSTFRKKLFLFQILKGMCLWCVVKP